MFCEGIKVRNDSQSNKKSKGKKFVVGSTCVNG